MSYEFNSLSLVRLMKSSMFGLRLSQFGKIQSFDFLKLIFRSLGSRWFNHQLCLFRIECRVDGLLGLHCIKDSGECNKDWITNNQYWSNWNKIWIRLDYEDGRNRRNLLEQSREPSTKLDRQMGSTLRDLNATNSTGRRVPSHHCATGTAPPNPLVRPIYQES